MLTQAERQQRRRDKQKEAGLVLLRRWVKPEQVAKIDAFINGLEPEMCGDRWLETGSPWKEEK